VTSRRFGRALAKRNGETDAARDRSGLAGSGQSITKSERSRSAVFRNRAIAAQRRGPTARETRALYPEEEKQRAQMSHVRRDVLEANFIIQGERVHRTFCPRPRLDIARGAEERGREGGESADIERAFPRADFARIRLGLHSRSP